jgi:hypothetical protein
MPRFGTPQVTATDWCTHQVGLAVTPVRGPKNPERAAITALAPGRVIANREENRKLDVTRLREAGLATRVTVFGARLARCPRVGKKQIRAAAPFSRRDRRTPEVAASSPRAAQSRLGLSTQRPCRSFGTH